MACVGRFGVPTLSASPSRTGFIGLAIALVLPCSATTVWVHASQPPGIHFTANVGQWSDSILYCAEAPHGTVWFTRGGTYAQLTEVISANQERRSAVVPEAALKVPAELRTLLVTTRFSGAKVNPRLDAEGQLASYSNYFLGNRPQRWRSRVPHYSAVVYRDMYPGIDMRYYGNGHGLEYDFLVAPGADLSKVRISHGGVDRVELTPAGSLLLHTSLGTVTQPKPVVYQVRGEDTLWISSAFLVREDGTVGFQINSPCEPTLALVVDPVIDFSTYLGGSGEDGRDLPDNLRGSVALTPGGDIIVAGQTTSADFPSASPYDNTFGGTHEVFVSRLTGTGGSLVYSTYLGGSDQDRCSALGLDPSGNPIITGMTCSPDFPTFNAFQSTRDALTCDAFVLRLSGDGTILMYSTYYGGGGTEWGLALDVNGNDIYVTGEAFGTLNLPVAGSPVQPAFGGGSGDAFVARFDPTGSGVGTLSQATYLGGLGGEFGLGIGVRSGGEVCVAVTTGGPGLSTPGSPVDPSYNGNWDLYYAQLSPALDAIQYGTYLGTGGNNHVRGLAVDASDNVLIAGTTAAGFPVTSGAASETFGGGAFDAFILKFTTLNVLAYSTYVGGDGTDEARHLTVDASGRAVLTGFTSSGSGFPIVREVQATQAGGNDAFVTVLSPDGSAFDMSTYLGGLQDDVGLGALVDAQNRFWLVGYTESGDFPTTSGAYDQSYNNGGDVFVTRITAIDQDGDGAVDDVDNCPTSANAGQQDGDGDGIGNVCDACPADFFNDVDLDGQCADVDNCPVTFNPGQEDGNANDIGDACEMSDLLTFDVYSPVDMVVTDAKGDSIGLGFNTIGLGSGYDTTQDVNSSALTGPDGETDDRITIPVPFEGGYSIRLVPEPGAAPGDKFTLAVRINGNQQLIPDGYRDASVSSIGTSIPATFEWVASTVLTGDVNGDGNYTSSDIILLVNYVFKSGAPPDPVSVGDVNCSGAVTSADIITMVNHVFKGGAPPCSNSAG